MSYPVRQKVVAYVTRRAGDTLQLLVFDHADFPEAGTQVPAGSIDPGESPEQAAFRETREEVGVRNLKLVRFLGTFEYFREDRQELHHRHVFWLEAEGDLPDAWEHIVSHGVEDKGLLFRCYWMEVTAARTALSGNQGEYLGALDLQD